MNAADDRLEILIGKLLDGELSPRERSLLENEIQVDSHAKELFEQMRVLHECNCGVVTHEVLGRGADPAVVFERAWQQSKRAWWRRVATGDVAAQGWAKGGRADGHLRFAVGIAAGLLLGLVLRFSWAPLSQPNSTISNLPSSPTQSLVAGDVPSDRYGPTSAIPVTPVRVTPRRVTGQVDWYVYTDRNGNQWLIEGTRVNRGTSAAYPDGL